VEVVRPADGCELYCGDALAVLPTLPAGSADAVVCDPPYGLGFMGQSWDTFAETPNEKRWNKRERNLACETTACVQGTARTGVTFAGPNPRCEKCGKVRRGHPDRICTCPDFTPAPRENRQAQRFQEWCGDWAAACYRVTKPGGYLLAFGGTRTWHRLACAVEDAGWEIRDTLMWLYGQGWPKSRGTMKPAWEPVLLARKPGPRVLPLNIDAVRIGTTDDTARPPCKTRWSGPFKGGHEQNGGHPGGRWPANVCLSCDCPEGDGHGPDCPVALLDAQAGPLRARGNRTPTKKRQSAGVWGAHGSNFGVGPDGPVNPGDSGGPSRFLYVAKASKSDRGKDNTHETVKPQTLMRWLVGLVSFPGEAVLDPFMGSGTTGLACLQTGRRFVGVELDPAYHEIARRRLAEAQGPLFAAAAGG
jgi:DNA modification methylase